MSTQKRYFVMHLLENEVGIPGRSDASKQYEIQILDAQGRAVAIVYAGNLETELSVGDQLVPKAVLEAARRQVPGKGDYVNEDGIHILPFDYKP